MVGSGIDLGVSEFHALGVPNCPGDTNFDGFVNVADLVNLLVDWSTDGSAHNGDAYGNGIVNVQDLTAVILVWGNCNP